LKKLGFLGGKYLASLRRTAANFAKICLHLEKLTDFVRASK